MIHSASESCIRIDRVHAAAIRKEIGERLRTRLNRERDQLPPRLLELMTRLRDAAAKRRT
jgi:hypothetical protein